MPREKKKAEEERLKALAEAEERAKLEAEEARLRAERRLANSKYRGLFVGPIEPEVGLLAEWWMENVPHNTYYQDDFDADMDKLWEKSLYQRFFVFGLLTQAKEESLLGGSEARAHEAEEADPIESLFLEQQNAQPFEHEYAETEEIKESPSAVGDYDEVSVIDEIYNSDDGSILNEEDEEMEIYED